MVLASIKKYILPTAISFFILILSGCATIMKGNSQIVQVSSVPDGAQIRINGVAIGTSPMSVKLDTSQEYDVELELEGYLPYSVKIKKSVSGWVWANILNAGLFGVIIDFSSGAVYKLDKEQVNAQLVKNGMGRFNPEEDNLYVFVTIKPDHTLEKIGQLTGSNL